MTWEGFRYEIDRSTREGEMARDRRAMRHLRELQVSRERSQHVDRRYVARSIGWLARAAQAAASWMA